ncbi:Peptide chain release factor RF2 [Candidatus Ecksteinia adelgidicola]|nr:Peptide chain release factor RF2 [Candidatus Ecksteinia adelgidicola]
MHQTNVVKNQIQNLLKRTATLKKNFNYKDKKELLKEINTKLEQPNFWEKPIIAKLLTKKRSMLENIVIVLEKLEKENQEINHLFEFAIAEKDINIFNEILISLDKITANIIQLEFRLMFSKKNDSSNCYLDIQSGSGGIEAQDWTSILLRMYLRWAEHKNFSTEIIEESNGEIAGLKSVTIKIIGNYAFGWLRTETGVHRLVRKSPFDSNRRRHTSFSSVFVYPEIDDDIEIEINSGDLRIDVYRASGAGGQHVNKTESAVRITHIPTNIVVQCQNNRSQHKNKDQAFKQLQAKLYQFEIQKKNTNKKIIEDNKSEIGWGSQIRSYILDSSRIKDLRTQIEIRNIQSVLDGDLDKFIEESLKAGL